MCKWHHTCVNAIASAKFPIKGATMVLLDTQPHFNQTVLKPRSQLLLWYLNVLYLISNWNKSLMKIKQNYAQVIVIIKSCDSNRDNRYQQKINLQTS